MPNTQIRKVLITAFGDESNVQVVDAEIADPDPLHVQVRVLFSGFSGSDINMRRGVYPLQKAAPLTPGYCFVGSITQVGQKCTRFTLPADSGALVCCLSVYDAEAELVNMPEKYLIRVPAGLDTTLVTALILDWNTAYGMVMRGAAVKNGQKVFVHGLSGAVGWATGVLCSLQGAKVYGTASLRNHAAIVRGLPDSTLFEYTKKEWIQAMKEIGGVDAVFDPLGFESWDESYSVLNPRSGGILVGYGGNLQTLGGGKPRSIIPPTVKLLVRGYLKFWDRRRALFYYISRDDKFFSKDLEALFKLLKDGKIKVPIKKIYDMENIQEAHKSWGYGEGVGSLLIKVKNE
ncbi:hypothetical protein HK100_003922 [Physocladia obscura]|uniref:Enoyl reductase (ER) domain-containing protein n=1 Tax=Physocladia obscura TaxID=109957 RepID=A0AAD5SV17_9FUNG|nr:hypothetical protein HK100_003922 [Physocladia obscura]